MVSTGLDIEDGNSVGDDCKSSKIVNANANTTSGVKMTVSKSFRFGGAKVTASEAAFA
jgi:hypothetical protein